MINNLSINFESEGLQYSIKVPLEETNLPYNLAEAFREVMEKSNANTDIVIRMLIETFDYTNKEENE